MDEIVEKIAREVMLKLKCEAGNRGASYSPPQPDSKNKAVRGKCTVVLVTANFKVVEQVMRQISAVLPQGGKLLISEYLQANCDSFARPAGIEMLSSRNVTPKDALKDAVELVIPSLSLNTLSKAANLIADSFATQVISHALIDGIPLVVTDESILDAGRYFPGGVAKKIDGFRRDLEGMGVCFQRSSATVKPDHKCANCQGGNSCANCATERNSASPGIVQPISTNPPASAGCLKEECPRTYGSCSSSCEHNVRTIVKAGADRIEKGFDAAIPARDLAGLIDHTLLKPTTTPAEITKLCEEARQHSFASVCVNPTNVALAARLLKGSPVKVCTVVGFPLGATSTFTKVMETRDCIANGANEIDMVINVGALKAKDYELVKNDIARVVEAAQGNTTKVILETSLLTKEEKIKGCELSRLAGADFVKTATGFSSGGATAEDIALMRSVVGPTMGVKASGGIRDTATAQQMVAAGATRIGASASVGIIKGEAASGKGY